MSPSLTYFHYNQISSMIVHPQVYSIHLHNSSPHKTYKSHTSFQISHYINSSPSSPVFNSSFPFINILLGSCYLHRKLNYDCIDKALSLLLYTLRTRTARLRHRLHKITPVSSPYSPSPCLPLSFTIILETLTRAESDLRSSCHCLDSSTPPSHSFPFRFPPRPRQTCCPACILATFPSPKNLLAFRTLLLALTPAHLFHHSRRYALLRGWLDALPSTLSAQIICISNDIASDLRYFLKFKNSSLPPSPTSLIPLPQSPYFDKHDTLYSLVYQQLVTMERCSGSYSPPSKQSHSVTTLPSQTSPLSPITYSFF